MGRTFSPQVSGTAGKTELRNLRDNDEGQLEKADEPL